MNKLDIPVAAEGLLAEFAEAGVIGWGGVHLARTLGWLAREQRPEVLLAVALALSVQEAGSVCLELDQVSSLRLGDFEDFGTDPDAGAPAELAWPPLDQWLAQLSGSPLVAVGESAAANQRPLRLIGTRCYLERNWQAEERVRLALVQRLTAEPVGYDDQRLDQAIADAFASLPGDESSSLQQRRAVHTSATSWTSVIAGGPGTGKTTTIAQLLKVIDELADRRTIVTLAAFTGKAAARMQQSLDASLALDGDAARSWRWLDVQPAATMHSVLGGRPGSGFRRNRDNPLPTDLLIVDEMSMVSLELMDALLDALPAQTRLVMVGDPDQLASVDAGAVLADIVAAGLPMSSLDQSSAITVLDHSHRFSGPIGELASAIRRSDVDAALTLLGAGGSEIEWIDTDPDPAALPLLGTLADDLVGQGRAMRQAAASGDPAAALQALDAHRLLCAHRHGRYGVSGWSRSVEGLLRREVSGYGREGEWYLGRPVLITRNANELQVFNGDTGVVVSVDGQPEVALAAGDTPRLRSPWLLDSAETMQALTVHKSQGSEYDVVTLVLPAVGSPLLTRELLYTALTRARARLRIIATPEAIAEAILTPARRATGLGSRLRPAEQEI